MSPSRYPGVDAGPYKRGAGEVGSSRGSQQQAGAPVISYPDSSRYVAAGRNLPARDNSKPPYPLHALPPRKPGDPSPPAGAVDKVAEAREDGSMLGHELRSLRDHLQRLTDDNQVGPGGGKHLCYTY